MVVDPTDVVRVGMLERVGFRSAMDFPSSHVGAQEVVQQTGPATARAKRMARARAKRRAAASSAVPSQVPEGFPGSEMD